MRYHSAASLPCLLKAGFSLIKWTIIITSLIILIQCFHLVMASAFNLHGVRSFGEHSTQQSTSALPLSFF